MRELFAAIGLFVMASSALGQSIPSTETQSSPSTQTQSPTDTTVLPTTSSSGMPNLFPELNSAQREIDDVAEAKAGELLKAEAEKDKEGTSKAELIKQRLKVPVLGDTSQGQPPVSLQKVEVPLPDDIDIDTSAAVQSEPQSSVLFDATRFGFDKEGAMHGLEGDVVLMGAGYVITSDKVSVNNVKKELTASGHVILIKGDQVFTGESIFLKWESGDFVIDKAVLVSSDPNKMRETSQKVLGLSTDELNFEIAKKARLESLRIQRESLKENFRLGPENEPSLDLIRQYTRLLEQSNLTAGAQAPSLAQRNETKRKAFERRRTFWEQSRAAADQGTIPINSYFRLEGDTIERKDGNSYVATNAIFTPCICEEGEAPAWGFQAKEIEAQQEGYVNFKHPVFTIKGIPIIYLPYLKLPLKTRRQSGFLMPSFQSDSKNGFVYTQPVFVDLGKAADATVTTDLFQKRGTRLGLETRYEARQDSGIRYQVETIRDRSWLELRSKRDNLVKYFLTDRGDSICANADAFVQRQCEQDLRHDLLAPANTWRGKQEWQGRYALAPRLSLVTKGKYVSDHRYLDDLYLPEDVVTAFAKQANANAFSTARAKANIDGKDFYFGLETAYGDYALATNQYSGQQLPIDMSLQSRYFRLFPASWWSTPSYAELRWQGLKVNESATAQTNPQEAVQSLGNGTWQRLGLQVTTPLVSRGVLRVDHFADAELRLVEHEKLEEESSRIRSWRTGFNMVLPMDGMGPLPLWMQPDVEGTRMLHHLMEWGFVFSLRPSVIRDGEYGLTTDRYKAPLVYFPSDRNQLFINDRDVPDEEIMVKHQRFTLYTSQKWRVFDRTMEPVQSASETKLKKDIDDLQTEARDELMSVRDRQLRSVDEIYRTGENNRLDWLIRRYRSVDKDQTEPVQFSAQISYDAIQEKLRREQLETNTLLDRQIIATADPEEAEALRGLRTSYTDLPESWIGPFTNLQINWRGFRIGNSLTYNLYKRTSTSIIFDLALPVFYGTNIGSRYSVEKAGDLDPASNQVLLKRIKTTTFGLTNQLFSSVSAGVNLIQRQVEGEEKRYGTSYQISYDDQSSCWGLRFVREKDLNQDEEDANYILQLAVIFLGNRRSADVSAALEREIQSNDER